MINLKFQEIIGFLLGPEMGEDRPGVCYPSLDVFENQHELCIEMEIPGVNPAEVNVEVAGHMVRITGAKKDMHMNSDIRYIRMERSFGKFSRDLDISDRFNIEKIEANFTDGVLKIKIPRVVDNEIEILKRIEIK